MPVGDGFRSPILGGGGTLTRARIVSPDFDGDVDDPLTTPGAAGWYLGRDGALVANNAVIRGAITATSGTFSGDLSIGTAPNIVKADSNGLYVGHGTFASAPFRVTPAGAVTATNLTLTGGSVDASLLLSGTVPLARLSGITADEIATGTLTSASGVFGTISADDISGGTVTGDIISGGLISGTTLRTATSGNHVRINSANIEIRSSASAVRGRLSYSGGTLTLDATAGTAAVLSLVGDRVEITATTSNNILCELGSSSGTFRIADNSSPALPGSTGFYYEHAEPLRLYRKTSTAGDGILALYSDEGSGSYNLRWLAYADGDTASTTGVYGTISDERLKSNIRPYRDPTDDLMAIPVVTYDVTHRIDGRRLGTFRRNQLGYGAQTVQAVKPGLVRVDSETGTLAVKTSLFIPMLHRGFQAHEHRLRRIEAELGLTT